MPLPWLGVTDPLAPLSAVPQVAAAIADARAAVDALLSNRVLRRRSADVSAESALRGAWASAVLEGAEAALADVRSGMASSQPLVQAALRAQSSIGTLDDSWSRAPRQALARLHAVAARDLVAQDALGRPTGGRPVAQRLDTLAQVVATTRAPALVVAGVVHGEVLALDAFAPVSGIVARAAARLTLVERGLDPKSLVVLEVGHLERRGEYQQALAGYRAGGPDAVAAWISHCADAVAAGAIEARAICEALARA